MKQYSRFTTTHKVRPDDIDMFNHVHNSIYLDYVLAARYEQMETYYGYSMQRFIDEGLGWVVKSVQINYKRPLSLGNEFSVETGITEITQTGCRVTFELKSLVTNKVCSDGFFDFVMIDIKTGKSQKLTAKMIENYSV